MSIFKKLNKKGAWKKLLIAFLVCLTAIASVTALVKVTNSESTKTLTVSDYCIANLNSSTGKKIDSTQHIVTKDYLSVDDMKIEIDDEPTIKYSIIFYNKDKEIVSGASVTNRATDYAESNISTTNAATVKYFKVVITPDEVDDEPVEINLLNYARYTKQLKITCSK